MQWPVRQGRIGKTAGPVQQLWLYRGACEREVLLLRLHHHSEQRFGTARELSSALADASRGALADELRLLAASLGAERLATIAG